MGEDDIVELLWKSGQVVRSIHSQRPPSVSLPILRGSGSGGGREENEPPPLHSYQQPSDQNLRIPEDEMASCLHHHPLREDEFRSHLFYSGVVSIPFTQPQGSVSLTAPPPASAIIYTTSATERPMGQVIASRRAENFINFSRLRENIYTGGRVEASAPWVPVVRDSTESCLKPATVTGALSQTFAVPSLSRKAIETVCEIAGPSSSGVSKAETEPIQIQPAADESKQKERKEPADDTKKETGEEVRGSTSRKRSRAAEMHNISEKRRREKINERMKALQELIPRCNKTDKASMLEDAIEYVKLLQMQIQMMSMGGGGMMPMMYTPNMQSFMPHTAIGKMAINRPPFIPFPGTAYLPSQQQPDLVPNQPQFPGYLNPYSQFGGLQQMQQPPSPLQNQTTSQLSSNQASSSKEPEDQDNKPTD